jgi:ribosomal protein S27E
MAHRGPHAPALTAILFALCCSAPAAAGPFETLLMPGAVSRAHQKLETNCAACHDRSDRSRQTALCLDCHKDVAADVTAGHGFHGRMLAARSGQCRGCHSEHHGRDADIVHLSRASFDHSLTEFHLEGAHAMVRCDGCHRTQVAFRKAPVTCIACHRGRDVHRGGLGTDCQQCHSASAWQRVSFDHEKTSFPLRDKHREVPCAACHIGEHYRGTPQKCVACHAPDDVHHGSRGNDCANCHTLAGWKSAKFDHGRETGFALEGAHAHVGCADCHRSGNLKDKLPKDCAGCHSGDDRHGGRFGSDCSGCHGNESWHVSAFDHTRFKFALEGAHAHIDCHACHSSIVKDQKLPIECAGCHRADDVHGGTLGRVCEQCHTTSKWKADIRFDHDVTDFPLLGLHVVVTCAQCHPTQAFKSAPHDCHDCHGKSDVHKGSLGTDCAACHSPNGWNLWQFDHGARTHFRLTGAHARLACADCHKKPANEAKLPTECGSCHAADDVHAGQFGGRCDRCHTTITFHGGRAN